jgi:hypothetical protein
VGGAFEPTAAPGERSTPLLPWTVQARVSDLAVLAGRLYLGVNGHGLASLEKPRAPGGPPTFRYYYDPLLFRYRTLTTLVPDTPFDDTGIPPGVARLGFVVKEFEGTYYLPENQLALGGTLQNLQWLDQGILTFRWLDADDAGSDGMYGVDNFKLSGVSTVPEPGGLSLCALGAAAVGALRRRWKTPGRAANHSA